MSDIATIPCPGCTGRLAFHVVDKLKIGICDGCGGAWFGSGQLDSLVKHGATALDELLAQDSSGPHEVHGGGNAACPACNLPLNPSTYSFGQPLHVSACYQCGGIFVDAASLDTLDGVAQKHAAGGASSFGHGGGFGSTPPVPSPAVAAAGIGSPQGRIHAISNGLFRRHAPSGFATGYGPGYYDAYGYDPGYAQDMRVQNTLVVADIAMDVLSMFL